jgi:two-component system cell cycle response regulator DivK
VGQKILVVEDNELNLRLFCDLLRAHGYEAEAVRDGREAIERARAFAPDLVVMDIQMPHISGLELIERMKADEELRRPPIMAVTAYAAKGDEERIRDAGAEGYVSKPISVLKFVEAVRALLDAATAKAAEVAEEEETAAQAEPVEESETPETQEAAEPEGEAAAEGTSEEEKPAEEPAADVTLNLFQGQATSRTEDGPPPARHPGEGRDPPSSDEADGSEEGGKVDPGSSPG